MFRVLLLGDIKANWVNTPRGLLRANLIPPSWLINEYSLYDRFRANNIISTQNNIELGCPTILDASNIKMHQDDILELLRLFHKTTGYGSQIGFLKESMNGIYTTDILKLIHFTICSVGLRSLDNWASELRAAHNNIAPFNKPAYCHIPLTYSTFGKLLDLEAIGSAINTAYAIGFDGAMIYDEYGTLGDGAYEVIIQMLNQMNE